MVEILSATEFSESPPERPAFPELQSTKNKVRPIDGDLPVFDIGPMGGPEEPEILNMSEFTTVAPLEKVDVGGKIVQAPQGLKAKHIEYLDAVQNQGANAKDYFAGVKLSPEDTQSATSEALVSRMKQGEQWGVKTRESIVRGVDAALRGVATGIKGTMRSDAIQFQKDRESDGLMNTINNFFGGDSEKFLAQKKIETQNYVRAADRLIATNQAKIQDLQAKAPNKTTFDLSGLGVTIPAAMGLTLATKNPLAAALVFGKVQQGNITNEALSAGKSEDEARSAGQQAGGIEGALEAVGGGVFLKVAKSSNFVRRAVAGFVNEGGQEALQTGGEALVTNLADVRNNSIEEIASDMLYSFAIGGVVGGPMTALLGGNPTQLKSELEAEYGVDPAQSGAMAKALVDNHDEFISSSTDILDDASDPILNGASAEDDVKTVYKAIMSNKVEVTGLISDMQSGMSLPDAIAKNTIAESMDKPARAEPEVEMPPTLTYGLGQVRTTPVNTSLYRQGRIKFDGQPGDLLTILRASSKGGRSDVFVADNPDLAIGQGDNQGVRIKFKPSYISAVENRKPGEGVTGKEYKANYIAKDAIEELEIDKAILAAESSKEGLVAQANMQELRKILSSGYDLISDDGIKLIYRPKEASSQSAPSTPLESAAPVTPETAAPLVKDLPSFSPEEAADIINSSGKKVREGDTITSAINSGLNKNLVPISSRLARFGAKFKYDMRRYQFDLETKTQSDLQGIAPWMQAYSKISPDDQQLMKSAMLNANGTQINDLVKKYGFEKEMQQYREVFDDAVKRARAAGIDTGYIENYFSRYIAKPKAFLDSLARSGDLVKLQAEFDGESARLKRPLTPQEKAQVADKVLAKAKPGVFKSRTKGSIPAEQLDLYMNPNEAAIRYVQAVNNEIESRKYLGNSLPDMQERIAFYTGKQVADGLILPSQQEELNEILMARFERGKLDTAFSAFRDLTYIDVMGGFTNAIAQFQDLALAYYNAGVIGMAKNTARSFAGKSILTKESVGLGEISQEFNDGKPDALTAKALKGVFKLSGLSSLDSLGANVNLNSAVDAYRSEARSKKPSPIFTRTIENIFGTEAPQVIKELKSGEMTENIAYLAYNRLLDMAPRALSEMPEGYLRADNRKILWTLKSFMLRQIDFYRNETLGLMKTDPVQGTKNLIRLTTALALAKAGTTFLQNLLSGKELDDPEDPMYWLWNVAAIMNLNKYDSDSLKRGEDLWDVIVSKVVPPAKFVNNVTRDIIDAPDDVQDARVVKSIPLVGNVLYNRVGAGSEDGKERKKDRKADERADKELSDDEEND